MTSEDCMKNRKPNAIGTEYVRADLLPPGEAAQVKSLLVQYLDARVTFYQSDYGSELQRVDTRSSTLQGRLCDAGTGGGAA